MKRLSSPPNKIEPTEGCLVNCLKVLGDKWTARILTELSIAPRRFTELQHSLTGISPRTLSQRLDSLVEHKIIAKQVFAEAPPRVEYTLLPKGRDFVPILKQMAHWGSKYSS